MIKFDYIVVKNLINKKTIKIILNELLRVTKIILASKEKNLNKALNKLSKKKKCNTFIIICSFIYFKILG